MMLRRTLLLSCVWMMLAAESQFVAAGKPAPPPSPTLPPVRYQVIHIAHPGPAGSTPVLNDFTDSMAAVGYSLLADDISGSGPRWPWLYDPMTDPSSAVDLNSLNLTGLDAGWCIRSAVGVNNNGLVVGYIAPLNDYSVLAQRGFVLDMLTMELSVIPDPGYGWSNYYPRRVNDNGDMMCGFTRADGTTGVVLSNAGLRGGNVGFEILNVITSYYDFELSNPAAGQPAKVAGKAANGSLFEYTQGGEVTFRTDLSTQVQEVNINDLGGIAGRGSITTQNKRTKSTVQVVYRNVFGTDEYLPGSYGIIQGLTNEGTVLIQNGTTNTLYVDGWNFVDVSTLYLPGEAPYGDQNGRSKINNLGLLGFAEIAGTTELEIFILTPVPAP